MRIKALLGSSALFLAFAVHALADTPVATDPGRTPDSAPGGQGLERRSTGGLLTLPQAGPAVATNLGPEAMKRHDACLVKAEKTPKEAYEDGLIWRAEGGGALALHCVARAQLALGQYVQHFPAYIASSAHDCDLETHDVSPVLRLVSPPGGSRGAGLASCPVEGGPGSRMSVSFWCRLWRSIFSSGFCCLSRKS